MEIDGVNDFSLKLKNLMEDEEDLNLINQYVVIISSDCGISIEKYSPSFLASVSMIISRVAEKLKYFLSDTNSIVEGDNTDLDVDDNIPRATKLAVSRLLPGSLYKFFIKSIKDFDSSSEPGKIIFQLIIKYFTENEESAKLTAAVSDYILRESFEAGKFAYTLRSSNQLNDLTQIAIDDVNLILESTKRNQDVEQASNFNINDIVERYGQFSWIHFFSGVSEDVELVELYKRLDIDPIFHATPNNENSILTEEQEQHSLQVKSIRRKLLFEHGIGGISADPRYTATYSLPSLADLREFCLSYAPVDPCGKTEDEDGDIDYDTEQLLKTIREAKDSKTVSIDITEVKGASFMQVLGALIFQVASNAIGKIQCTSTVSVDDFSIMEFLIENFPKNFDASKVEWPTDDITILNTTFDCFLYSTSEIIFRIVWAGKTATFASNLPDLKDRVNDYIYSTDGTGLSDEDTMGELRPLHVAAYKSSNSCITTLIDVLKCDINSTAFDGSNAFFWGMANNCRLDTLELLISRGCDVNNQIFHGPGWQSWLTDFAGFSPLMFAVNVGNIDYVRLLLAAGANTELYTGPLVMNFPLQPRLLLHVNEYEWDGFTFNALHIASIMNNAPIISALLQAKATVDARILPNHDAKIVEEAKVVRKRQDITDAAHPVENSHFATELVHLLKTPLHLLPPSEVTATKLLVKSGASLLAQDLQLQAAGSCHPHVVKEWFASGSGSIGTRTALIVCARKKLNIDCAHRVVEYLVSLHLLDHVLRSCRQEMSATLWPWMALSLTHQKLQSERNNASLASSWILHKEQILDALSNHNRINGLLNDESVIDEKYASAFAFTRDQLLASKLEKSSELLDIITPSIFALKYPVAEETENNGHNQRAKLA